MKKNIGSVLRLYPSPLVVVGTMINEKCILVGHLGIKETKLLSINIVDEVLLKKADYVGCVSGLTVDKSEVFEYYMGESGASIITASPLTIKCSVEDIYDKKCFDNFILNIENTYVEEKILNEVGKINYHQLKPVLFEIPKYIDILVCTNYGE